MFYINLGHCEQRQYNKCYDVATIKIYYYVQEVYIYQDVQIDILCTAPPLVTEITQTYKGYDAS